MRCSAAFCAVMSLAVISTTWSLLSGSGILRALISIVRSMPSVMCWVCS